MSDVTATGSPDPAPIHPAPPDSRPLDPSAVRDWIADDVDPDAAAELEALLEAAESGDAGASAELADRFRAPLAFGTAGLRGPLRAGPNGMNRTVVRRAAAGLATWLNARLGAPGRIVVVGYDARHGSWEFAHDSAAIFSAAGFDARILPGALPTPLLAYAVRTLDAVLGVMVTASHNPAQDNGYKVYLGGRGWPDDGAQIVPPIDGQIEAAIRAVGPTRDIPMDRGFSVASHALTDAYVSAVADIAPHGPRRLSIVHTAMHGVGSVIAQRVLSAAGFLAPTVVHEQARPDPDFPTVAFPNPEEPGALDLALRYAQEADADLVIAHDPDADRCAAAVPVEGTWRRLTGDELGVLLADDLLRRHTPGVYATTIVSSTLLASMAAARGAQYAETLTGFKWIVRAADDIAYGYEEALGYAVAPELVRDKDGISAGVVLAALAARLKAEGSSLTQRLDELAMEFGLHANDQLSIRVERLEDIDRMMTRIRAAAPATLLGAAVSTQDLAPDADVVTLRFSGGRVVVRPSGTEPKLKAYLEVVLPVGDAGIGAARAEAATRIEQLRAEVAAALGHERAGS